MKTIFSFVPALCVLVSLIAVPLIGLARNRPAIRESVTLVAATLQFLLAASMISVVIEGNIIQYPVVEIMPGVTLLFRADVIGVIFATVASFLWVLTSVYSIGYLNSLNESHRTRYFAFFALAMTATMGVAFSGNVITMFVFYEIITLSTYPLVAHKETDEARRGARKYLIYLLGTSIAFFLPAVIITHAIKGHTTFAATGIFDGTENPAVLGMLFLMFVAGTVKTGVMPFHAWLPAAMVAPTPVSALLHAVAVVKAGVFVMLRIVTNVFGPFVMVENGFGSVLAIIASVTIIVASLIAMRQDNLKRLLAYSTIGQLSYIILGAALLTPASLAGSVIHVSAHAFGKITLFFAAGAIYAATHKTNISELDGIGRRMPLTMGAFAVGALSMVGLPGTGGFVSKWYIASGAAEIGSIGALVVIATSTVLNACYFLPILYRAFFCKDRSARHAAEGGEAVAEASRLMVVPIILTAAAAALIFVMPSPVVVLAEKAVAAVDWVGVR